MNLNVAQSFNFFPVPTDIHFGCGIVRTLPERIRATGGTRAFVVTDPGIRATGLLEAILHILQEACIDAVA